MLSCLWIAQDGVKHQLMILRLVMVLLTFVLATPLIVIVSNLVDPNGEVLSHLIDTVLAEYLTNSFIIMIGVGLGTVILGVSAAWLTSMCQFPGRSIFEWALLLPMAIPAYIIAYSYTGLLDFAGPIQTFLRDTFNLSYGDYYFPEIRSLGGAISMLTLVLFPYVYLLARAAFINQSICVLDVSRTLGYGPFRTFKTVALPLARPAIIAGASIAMMETLADYGTVEYFGIATFTTGILRTWYGLDSAVGASQLASILLIFVFSLVFLEQYSRRHARYHHTSQRHQAIDRIPLLGKAKVSAILFCSALVAFGFLIPAAQFLTWWISLGSEAISSDYLQLITHSVELALISALFILAVAVIFAYGKRLNKSAWMNPVMRISSLGYAMPGTVVAIGVLIPLTWFDNTLDSFMRETFDISTGLLLSGSLAGLLFAYLIRFLTLSLQTVDSGLERIKHSMEEAAKTMGYGHREILTKIHLPILRGSLLTAILMVFVDVLKELPATLVLRPFDFNTLAVKAFELASDERLMETAPYALTIVAVGIVPVIFLSRSITKTRDVKS